MATFRSAQALAMHQRAVGQRVARTLTMEGEQAAQRTRDEAHRQTGGSVSSADLRRLDHPFARRHGSPRMPPLPINRQTGELQGSLRLRRIRAGGGVDRYELSFGARHAQYVLAPSGTRAMLPRGFWAALQEFYRRISRGRLLNAKRAAER